MLIAVERRMATAEDELIDGGNGHWELHEEIVISP